MIFALFRTLWLFVSEGKDGRNKEKKERKKRKSARENE